MDPKQIIKEIFLAGIESVMPDKLMKEVIVCHNGLLKVCGFSLDLSTIQNIYVIGAGKASAIMARGLEAILPGKIREGHIVVKYGYGVPLHRIKITEAGHPIPDENGCKGTQTILSIAQKAQKNDLVICLISGGGSALLADVPEGSTLRDLDELNDLLLKSSATINEINTVRKHLSLIKGGNLARQVFPARLITFVLSDVIGDPLDTIASGPTTPDPTTYKDVIKVIEKYELTEKVPKSLLRHLEKGVNGYIPDTPKHGDPIFEKAYNFIIGNNKKALNAASEMALSKGLNAIIVTSELRGDTLEKGEEIVQKAKNIQQDRTVGKPCCLLYGGETTLKISGKGIGGRNQHLALYVACLLRGGRGITFLAAGTDGTDGPTDAAGAIIDNETTDLARKNGISAKEYLENFDSYHFFQKAGGQIITGPTMTNVMDLVVVLVE
jgi:glycerate 2-kinase